MQGLANQITRESNPFGAYRDQYAQQLQALMANPTSVERDPGFTGSRDQSLQQVQKLMAAQGYKGSGNMAAALYDRSNNFELDYINNKENQLAQLAGAGITPNYSGAVSAQGAAAGLESSGLAAIGAGLGYAAPAINVLGGGAAAGTPAAAKPGGFSSAGGEAAEDLGLAGAGLSLAGKIGSIANSASGGGSTSDLASTAGGLVAAGGIASGIAKGGAAGYAQAAGNAGKLYNKVTGNTGGFAGMLGQIGAGLNVYQGLTSGTPQGTIGGVASGVGLAASSGAASAAGASAGTVAALGTAATGVGAVLAIPAVTSGVGDLIFGDLFGMNSADKHGNELGILRTRSNSGITQKPGSSSISQGGLSSIGASAKGEQGTQDFYKGQNITDLLAGPETVQKASDLLLSGDMQAYTAFMDSLIAGKSSKATPVSPPHVQPIQTGQVLQGLAMGIQNNFKGLSHA
jgi:hypothetical protein